MSGRTVEVREDRVDVNADVVVDMADVVDDMADVMAFVADFVDRYDPKMRRNDLARTSKNSH